MDKNIVVFVDRPLAALLEVMAVFVGSGEGLAAGGAGAVDGSQGREVVAKKLMNISRGCRRS